MAQKAIRSVKLTDSLTLSECKDGFWLYDYTQGYNIAVRAKTEQEAFVQALKFYQKYYFKERDENTFIITKLSEFIESVKDIDGIYTTCDCPET